MHPDSHGPAGPGEGRLMPPNIFSEPAWIEAWNDAIRGSHRMTSFAAEGLSLTTRRRRRPYWQNRFVELPAQILSYDISPLLEKAKLRASFEALARSGQWDVIDLRHLSAAGGFAEAAHQVFDPRFVCREIDDDPVWELPLAGTFAEYQSSLEGSSRSKFSYYVNRIKKMPGFKFYFEREKVRELFDRFLLLHKERIGSMDRETLLANPVYENFFRNITGVYHQEGTLRLACLELDGAVAAVLLGVQKHDAFYYLNSGFSSKYSKYSLGIVLPLLCIEEALAQHLRSFNLLGGDEPYKAKLGAVPHRTRRVLVFKNKCSEWIEGFFLKAELRRES